MKRVWMRGITVFSIAALAMMSTTCDFLTYKEFNPDANVPKNLADEGNYLVFGVSTGGTADNSITKNADGTITLKARNDGYTAGKIAGSEDGITYYFREVDVSQNFKLSAVVRVDWFAGRDTDGVTVTSNGQEGFGLMARDYVPQYPGFTIADIPAIVAAGGEYQARPIDPATGAQYASVPGGAGNMVMVGAVKRGMRAAIRYGVSGTFEPPTAAAATCVTNPNVIANAGKSIFEYWPKELADYSMYASLPDRPEFPLEGASYRLSLVKTNSAFICTIIPPPGRGTTQEYTFKRPDILKQVNKAKYYVGLFASRSAIVTFSDINYFESDSTMDAPAEPVAPDIISPGFSIISPSTDSDAAHRIYAVSNVKGLVSVTQNGQPVPGEGGTDFFRGTWYSTATMPSEAAIMADQCLFEIPVLPLVEGDNAFQLVFYPDESPLIATSASITRNLNVERRAYFDANSPIYVSPAGRATNAGGRESPLDLKTAIAFVLPGQKIVMLDGIYSPESLDIPRFNSGSPGKYKQLVAEERGKVIVDFLRNPLSTGLILRGDYWRLDGFHVRNAPDKVKGVTIMGNNNILEYMWAYNNGDTGFQISGTSTESRTRWPDGNLIRYCDSFDNKDAAQQDADGFAAKLTVGDNNVFQWCSAHNNCDDGWDLFTKKESGLIPPVTLENCVTYRSGTLSDGTPTVTGRNGFKLGGEGLGVAHVLKNCLSFQNGANGFTSNSNGDIQLENCTSFDNGIAAWNAVGAAALNYTIYNSSGKIDAISMKKKVTGILSLYTDGTGRSEDKVILMSNADGYAWLGTMTGSGPGTATRNRSNTVLVDATHPLSALVVSATPPLDADHTFTWRRDATGPEITTYYIPRDAQGRFVMGGFMELKPGTTTDAIAPGADFTY